MRVERSVQIAVPPQRVFARLADWRDHGQWQSTVESVEAPDELGLGSQLVEVRSAFGTRLTFDATVVEFAPPTVISLRGHSRGRLALDVVETFTVTPAPGGSTVSMAAEAELPLIFRPMQAGIVLEVERQIEGGLRSLKQLLESSP